MTCEFLRHCCGNLQYNSHLQFIFTCRKAKEKLLNADLKRRKQDAKRRFTLVSGNKDMFPFFGPFTSMKRMICATISSGFGRIL